MEKYFHIGDILSITTSQLIFPRKIDGIYNILNFMTSDSLSEKQLLRAVEVCRGYLLEEHPQLNHLNTSGITAETWTEKLTWLHDQISRVDEKLLVTQLSEEELKRYRHHWNK